MPTRTTTGDKHDSEAKDPDSEINAGPGIHLDLQALAVPLHHLDPLPGNPRVGDVDAVARSYRKFGQRKPIVAKRNGKRGTVLAGNHQLLAAQKLGWLEIAVIFTDDDEATAKAYALADNRTAELGSTDDQKLLDMIEQIKSADKDRSLIAATGWEQEKLAAMKKHLVAFMSGPAGDQTPQLALTYAIVVECKNEAEHLKLIARFEAEGLKCRAVVA